MQRGSELEKLAAAADDRRELLRKCVLPGHATESNNAQPRYVEANRQVWHRRWQFRCRKRFDEPKSLEGAPGEPVVRLRMVETEPGFHGS